jgi:hypothetical protein
MIRGRSLFCLPKYLKPTQFGITLKYAIMRVEVNQEALKLNGTHQLLVYSGGVNILEGSTSTIK